jgi:hypothetical protein
MKQRRPLQRRDGLRHRTPDPDRERKQKNARLQAKHDEITRQTGSRIDILIALGSIGAGIYLLQSHHRAAAVCSRSSVTGMGAYFVAKGFFMGRSLSQQARVVDRLGELVDLSTIQYEIATGENVRGLVDSQADAKDLLDATIATKR